MSARTGRAAHYTAWLLGVPDAATPDFVNDG